MQARFSLSLEPLLQLRIVLNLFHLPRNARLVKELDLFFIVVVGAIMLGFLLPKLDVGMALAKVVNHGAEG